MEEKIMTAGRQLAQLRARIKRKIERTINNYNKPSVTDESVLDLLTEILHFVETTDERYNIKKGGLGK